MLYEVTKLHSQHLFSVTGTVRNYNTNSKIQFFVVSARKKELYGLLFRSDQIQTLLHMHYKTTLMHIIEIKVKSSC